MTLEVPAPGVVPADAVRPDTATEQLEKLHAEYARLESKLTVRWNEGYERLVIPNGNSSAPVHRWFRLKEAFSADLLPRALKDAGLTGETGLRILDPFIGSGTTAVAAAKLVSDGVLRDAYLVGFECNPFIHLVADTKLRALQHPSRTFLSLAKKIAAQVVQGKVTAPDPPALAAFGNPDYFAAEDLTRLLQLRAAIETESAAGAEPLDVDLARVCLGAIVEPVSSLRRDGRALRYVPSKERLRPVSEFLERAHWMDEDMPPKGVKIRGRVVLGDGRSLRPQGPTKESIDLALFSPPYPNNIDYTEVYKLEAWLLAFISDGAQFADQRRKTVYSHPSLLRKGDESCVGSNWLAQLPESVKALLLAVPDDRYSRARRTMIAGYAQDMSQTLRACYRALRQGGLLVYVVGNSLHGSSANAFIIAADLIIADIATSVGFEVQRVEIARRLRRRRHDSPFLRESVVYLRKPGLGGEER